MVMSLLGSHVLTKKFSPHYFGGQNCLGSVGNFLALLFLNITSKFIAFVPNFMSSILSCATNPVQVYPYISQSLSSLLFTFSDLAMFGRGNQVVELVKNMFDLQDFNVQYSYSFLNLWSYRDNCPLMNDQHCS